MHIVNINEVLVTVHRGIKIYLNSQLNECEINYEAEQLQCQDDKANAYADSSEYAGHTVAKGHLYQKVAYGLT